VTMPREHVLKRDVERPRLDRGVLDAGGEGDSDAPHVSEAAKRLAQGNAVEPQNYWLGRAEFQDVGSGCCVRARIEQGNERESRHDHMSHSNLG
jgi:hypothetical protein